MKIEDYVKQSFKKIEEYLNNCNMCLDCKFYIGEDDLGWGHCALRELKIYKEIELMSGYLLPKDTEMVLMYKEDFLRNKENIIKLEDKKDE